MDYWIQKAKIEDMEAILRIYARARDFMAASGNPTQWINGYPERELLTGDIRNGEHRFPRFRPGVDRNSERP